MLKIIRTVDRVDQSLEPFGPASHASGEPLPCGHTKRFWFDVGESVSESGVKLPQTWICVMCEMSKQFQRGQQAQPRYEDRIRQAIEIGHQRGARAMAEKAAQLRETVLAILMDSHIGNFGMYKQFAEPKADAIEAAIRSLAGAEPQSSSIPNKENE